jgi:hypothetical protein
MGTPSSQGNSSWVGSESGEGAIVEVIGATLVMRLMGLFPLALGKIIYWLELRWGQNTMVIIAFF